MGKGHNKIMHLGKQPYVVEKKNSNGSYDLRNLLTNNIKYNVPSVVVYLGFSKAPRVLRQSMNYSGGFNVKLNKKRRG